MRPPKKDCWFRATAGSIGARCPSRLRRQPAAGYTCGTTTASIRAVRTSNGDSYVWALTSRQLEVSGDGGKTWIARLAAF